MCDDWGDCIIFAESYTILSEISSSGINHTSVDTRVVIIESSFSVGT